MLHACRTRRAVGFGLVASLLIMASWATTVHAARSAPAAPPRGMDIGDDFRALAQQRPWRCAVAPSGPVPATGWTSEAPLCAWQDRLRMQSWSGPGLPQGSTCVSAAAAWWSWIRGKDAAPLWHAAWPANSARDDSGAIKRIVLIREVSQGEWKVTEWRWSPSPRLATRAWQLSRWNALAARAEQFRQTVLASGTQETRMLNQVLEANLRHRPAERNGDVLTWQTDGLCLKVDAAAPGAQQLQLPYSADDSRLEQRAAMQLQLARRFPKATWLSTFNLVPTARHARGGAKFFAVWVDGGAIKGQLWMPTRGDGPLLRVRIATRVPANAATATLTPADLAGDPAVVLRRQVIERELKNVAALWASTYE